MYEHFCDWLYTQITDSSLINTGDYITGGAIYYSKPIYLSACWFLQSRSPPAIPKIVSNKVKFRNAERTGAGNISKLIITRPCSVRKNYKSCAGQNARCCTNYTFYYSPAEFVRPCWRLEHWGRAVIRAREKHDRDIAAAIRNL